MGTGTLGVWNPLAGVCVLAAITVIAGAAAAGAGDIVGRQAAISDLAPRGSIETVHFADPKQPPVKVVRGADPIGGVRMRGEIITFGSGTAQRVAVFRGITEPASIPGVGSAQPAAPTTPGAVILRGAAVPGISTVDLFSPEVDEHFARIADAVHGVESRYGTDLRMWRLDDPGGPQGPMQVSAAAALDVGGGDRFDWSDNIVLGRAYLVRLYRKYGNWPDALAAYNWGPGNVDHWIARGRPAAQLPAETTRYIERVLQLASAGTTQQRLSKR
jgi:hypothetical protein